MASATKAPKVTVGIVIPCPKALHTRLKIAAAEDEMALQELCVRAITAYLHGRSARPATAAAGVPTA